ncbi:MAG: hypothetical protein V1668_02905 [Patescibacteria group bacterium]
MSNKQGNNESPVSRDIDLDEEREGKVRTNDHLGHAETLGVTLV